jgi:hypothetical protein
VLFTPALVLLTPSARGGFFVGRLLRENENRGKTPEQQIREGMCWEPVEKAKADERQGTRTDLTSEKIFSEVEGGRITDIIARRVGLGSGKTYEKGKAVVERINSELLDSTIGCHTGQPIFAYCR